MSADARRLAEQGGMAGWIERLDRLAAGDLEPWRLPGDEGRVRLASVD